MLFSNTMSWQGLPSQAKAVSYGGGVDYRESPTCIGAFRLFVLKQDSAQLAKLRKIWRLALPLPFCVLPSLREYVPNRPTIHKG